MREEILVLDFGSQYNQLIARRIRDLGVYSELVNYDITKEEILSRNVKGIVLSGGPNSVYDEKSFRPNDEIFELGLPILGICYGMQYISYHYGAKVVSSLAKEYGGKELYVDSDSSILFSNTSKSQMVWMSHGDSVVEAPLGFTKVAHTSDCPVAAIENKEKNIYAVQFHPEVNNSVEGKKVLDNFITKICKCEKTWNMDSYIEEQISEIRNIVKDKDVLLGISGGVDSTVAAVLINKAIGSQLKCMFIDHGLLRKDEANIVMNRFNHFGIDVTKVDASKLFLDLLKGVKDPEQKRKIIGNTFVKVFDEESQKIGDYSF